MEECSRRKRRKRPPPSCFLLLLFLAAAASFPLSFSATTTDSGDASLMRKLASAIKPPGWSPTGDPCADDWRGVSCEAGRVVEINLESENLAGSLPADLNRLTALRTLALQDNALSGALPTLANMSDLQTVYLDGNHFSSIPGTFFSGLTSLQLISLSGNALAPWSLPADLAQCTALATFYAGDAGVTGSLPDFLGQLPNLQSVRLSYNNISGSLPKSFAGSGIQNLWLNNQVSSDKLSGPIDVLASMTQAAQVWLHANAFTGPVPDLSNCTNLFDLQLRDNQLTGVLPNSLFDLPSLLNVSLGNNAFQGPFPSFKSGVKVDKNIGQNNFCDTKPGDCDSGVQILLSVEKAFGYPKELADSWKGNDPCDGWSFVSCDSQKKNVTVLSLGSQHLAGTISPDIAKLTSLRVLILSNNNLTGSIPDSLTSLSQLQTVDVSNNNLSGKIPSFRQNVALKISGNPNLGAEAPDAGSGSSSSGQDGASPDGSPSMTKASSLPLKVIIPVVCVVAILVGIVALICIKKNKKSRADKRTVIKPKDEKMIAADVNGKGVLNSMPTSGSNEVRELQVMESGTLALSIQVLRQVTNNFSDDHEVGRGGFGIVYRGKLHNGTEIAVKRMESSVVSTKGMDEFQSEISVLTKVRHRHLVALLGYCVESNERLLVYEYMPQGTLGQHLFEWQELGYRPLTWKQRLTIALDVSRGVEYLHSLAQKSFIHRDLKPSNILLGDDMRAKVSDFGLVKLAPEGKSAVETRLAGTFGYLAPEYCATGRVTTKVDVYSFGVILMELIAGRKVLDESQPEERTHLVTWFRRAMISKDNMLKALDPTLNPHDEDDTFPSICRVAELAGHCTARDPFQRPDVGHAVNVLAPLVEQWKPASPGQDEGVGVNFPMSLPQVVERWQANEGSSMTSDMIYSQLGSSDNTQNSIEPSAFPQTFTPSHAR